MIEPLKKLLLLLVAQIPIAGAAVAFWGRIGEHPLVAAVIAVGYEALCLVVGFVAKVWKDELERDVVKALGGWARTAFLNFSSPFRREYTAQIRYDHRTFNVRGLRTMGAHALELDHVFVELRIAPSHMQQASADPIAERELPHAGRIWDFLRLVAKKPATALAIVGPPGCGKTTLLQHVALTFAGNRQRKLGLPAYLPVFLFLRDHVEAITSAEPPTIAALAGAKASKRMTSKPPPDFFENALRKGRVVVLLDGLDEVAKDEERLRVSQWVELQMSAYPRSPFLLTARPQGYRSAPLDRAHVLEVQPFGPQQVQDFVKNWYLANEITKHGGKDDVGVRQKAEEQAQDLVKRLRMHSAFGALSRNPLLLTMIAMVHNYRGALPGRRVELYAEICDVLLGHWQTGKGIQTPLTAAQLRVALQPLAAAMMVQGVREIGTEDALRVMERALGEIGVAEEAKKEFLKDVQDRSGLLLERERGRWAFAHLTFQEYLAAAHFIESGLPTRLDVAVSEPWWHETLRLFAAQGDATPVLEACLAAKERVEAVALACECVEEAKKMAPELRARVHEIAEEGLDSEDGDRFRLAAEVRLARRLRSFHRIDDEHSIDLSHVTCAEYQLFLDDAQQKARKRLHPDHWPSDHFAKGEARKAVVGVRASDAVAFVEWLNQRGQGSEKLRLPWKHEVEALPANQAEVGTWCLRMGILCEFNLAALQEGCEQLGGIVFEPPPLPPLTRPSLAIESLVVDATALANALDPEQYDTSQRYVIERSVDSHRVELWRALRRTISIEVNLRALLSGAIRAQVTRANERWARALPESRALDFFSQRQRAMLQTASPEEQLFFNVASREIAANAFARTDLSAQRMLRRLALIILEAAWHGRESIKLQDKNPRLDPALEKSLIGTYWWLRMIDAQIEGKLPVWGGIRLVRDTSQ